ncbi:IS3 family transposase, partial [Mesorhizobium sp. M2D.F.Ca.ET.206.01.1.1]
RERMKAIAQERRRFGYRRLLVMPQESGPHRPRYELLIQAEDPRLSTGSSKRCPYG